MRDGVGLPVTTQTLIGNTGLRHDRGGGNCSLCSEVWWLYKLVMSGPASGRAGNLGTASGPEYSEVLGQHRLLKWSGLAHFFTMWGFFILLTDISRLTYRSRRDSHIPVISRWDALRLPAGLLTAVFLGITTFAIIRILRNRESVRALSPVYLDRTTAARGSSC